ncbi:MAG: NUDIX domain-containing protein [Acholeplasmataceae bacterium]
MIALSPIIIEEGLTKKPEKQRKTVRAVMVNDKEEVLLVYSSHFDDYTFPGGGIKGEETEKRALKRELKEEIGAKGIKIIEPLGYIKEIKYGLFKNDTVYLQKSIYYIVEIEGIGIQHLDHRETLHGVKPMWVKIDEAIKHNQMVSLDEKHQAYGLKTVLKREQCVLEKLKERLLNEKI